MKIGVSSSCFYPLETEKSFMTLAELGVKTTEVFFNSPSELKKPFVEELNRIKTEHKMDVVSIHSFASFAEGYYIFSEYKRRFYDSLEMYKPHFNAAAQLGARYVILHGSRVSGVITTEEYAERFAVFSSEAKKFGVQVLHENVVNYVGQSPKFMAEMKQLLGEDFKMVLDLKQARRAGYDPLEFVDAVGTSIKHLHLSDCRGEQLCTPPSESGEYDFKKLFERMNGIGYDGVGMIELYSNNYRSNSELVEAMEYLNEKMNSE